MAKFQDDKFIIINKKHLNPMNVPSNIFSKFMTVLREVQQFLPDHKYIACNQDEPYAEQVKKIILDGETCKENTSAAGGNASYSEGDPQPVQKPDTLRNVICPQCGKPFRLIFDETVNYRSCPSGGVYDSYISCPHCDYEEEL